MARIKGSFTVFPASAGVIPILHGPLMTVSSLSRVSGGDPIVAEAAMYDVVSLPRQRG